MPAQKAKIDPDALFTAGAQWESVAMGLLVSLLAFGPASFGAVEAWSQLVILTAAAALSILVAARAVVDRDFRPVVTWIYIPLALFILLVAAQLLPMPLALAKLLSPSTVATKQEMLGGSVSTFGPTTISFYPRATAEHLRLVLLGTAVFVGVANMIRGSRQVKFLLVAIFAIGCAEGLLAIAQIASASDRIYWNFPLGRGIVTSGTFVNYSHFSQFMNLSLGAGVAYLLIQFREHGRKESSRAAWQYSITHLGWEKYGWLFFGIVLCAITVLTSMSRNGAISMFVAAAVVGAALYRRGSLSWKGWLLGAAPLAVLTVLLVVGFDVVYVRLATLQDSGAIASRWEMTAATLRAWLHYPLWGTGLGTHEFVFPMFDTSVTPGVAAHADNDYAQLLEETGIAGALLVGAFLVGCIVLVVRIAMRGRSSAAAGVFGLALGLIAVAIHSTSDFGQRIPAVLSLSAALCGVLVAIDQHEARLRRSRRREQVDAPRLPFQYRRGIALTGLVAVVGIWCWALYGAYFSYLGEQWWSAALAMESRIDRDSQRATDQDYNDLIVAADGAFQRDPENVNYGYWLNSYRWEALGRPDADTGETVLHPDTLPFVERIADDLAGVRQLCPTYGPPYALEGQLRLYVLNDQSGAELIRKGVRLAAYDAPTCLAAGELAAREGRVNEAEPLLKRAVSLRPEYFRTAAEVYLNVVQRPDLARALAGGNFWRLNELVQICAANPQYTQLVDEIRASATASLRHRVDLAVATPLEVAMLARAEYQDGDLESSIGLFRQALTQDYRQLDWRLELARALADSNLLEDAMHELEICLRLRQGWAPALEFRNALIDRIEKISN